MQLSFDKLAMSWFTEGHQFLKQNIQEDCPFLTVICPRGMLDYPGFVTMKDFTWTSNHNKNVTSWRLNLRSRSTPVFVTKLLHLPSMRHTHCCMFSRTIINPFKTTSVSVRYLKCFILCSITQGNTL